MSDRKITFSKEERVHESYLNKRKSEISKSLMNAEMLSYISDEASADIERIKLKFSQIDDKLSNFETLKKYVEIQNDLFIFNEKHDTEKFWHAEKIINLDDKKIYVLIASKNETYWLADEFFNVISKITFEEYEEKCNSCNLADYYCKTRRFDLYEKFEVEFELLRVEKYKATNYDFIVNIGHNVLVACLNGKFLIIDEKGQKISKTKYDYISTFNNLGIAYVSVNGKMGLINDKKIIICKPIFTNISEFVFDIAIVHIKGKFGLINKNGKIICKLKYDDISPFNSAGVAFTRLNRKIGLINTNGKELVPNIFDLITHFNDKNVAKGISNQKIGFINIEGKILIEPKYDEVYEFNTKGVAIYRIGKKYGFVNNSGMELCDAIFDKINNFNSEGIVIAEINHVYGIVNDEGIALTDIEYGYIDPFQFGYARVSNLQNKWGIINSKGETIIKCECKDIRKITNFVYFICTYDEYKFWNTYYNKFLGSYFIPYSSYERAIDNINGDGTIICNYILRDEKVPKKIFITSDFEEIKIDATTEITKYDLPGIYKIKSIGKYGLINKNGEIILKAEYDDIGSFGEGRIATIKLSKKYGFINRDLQVVVEPTYDLIIGFTDYILFELNRKCGLLDYEGNILLEPSYDDISLAYTKRRSIYNEKGLSLFNSYGVAEIRNGEKYGFIDSSFKEICSPQYDGIEPFDKNGYAKTKKQFNTSSIWQCYYLYGLIDYKGNEILKTEYDSIEPLGNTNLFIISQLTMYGLANHEGNIILSWFDSISKPDKYGLIRVCKKELYGLANSEGKLLIEPTYNRIEEFDNEGFAKVFKFGLYGIIDKDGNVILAPRYDSIGTPNKLGIIKYSISERYGIMTRDYTNLTEYLFDEIGEFNDSGFAIVRKRGLYGIINVSGEVLIECKYDNIEFTNYDKIISMKLNHKYTLYDLKHNRKSCHEYDMIWNTTVYDGIIPCERDGEVLNININDDSVWE